MSRLERLAARQLGCPISGTNIAGSSRRARPLKSHTAFDQLGYARFGERQKARTARVCRIVSTTSAQPVHSTRMLVLCECDRKDAATALNRGLCAICILDDGADAACQLLNTVIVTMGPVQPKLSPSCSEEGGYTAYCRRCILDGSGATVRPSTVRRAFAESTRSRGVTTISAKQIVSFTHLPPS